MARSFPTVGPFRHGYHKDQVTDFVLQANRAYERTVQGRETDWDAERVRSGSFSMVRGGFDPRAVDRTLDRLEDAFVRRGRAQSFRRNPEVWEAHVADLQESILERLQRPRGERFDRPRRLRSGYDARQVDLLLDGVLRVVTRAKGPQRLTAADIRQATFDRARGNSAYDEAVVDVFLDRVIEVLLATA